MGRYTVELVKLIRVEDIEANSAKEAQLIAQTISKSRKGNSEDFDVQSTYDQVNEAEVMICECCGGDILPESKYSTSDEDGYSVCEKCTAEGIADADGKS